MSVDALVEQPLDAKAAVSSSWSPVDLEHVLDGEQPDRSPSMLLRTDGLALAYPGMLHSFAGKPESLKSATAQAWAAEQIQAERPVLYLDFETSAWEVCDRLLALGLDQAQVYFFLRYVAPSEPLNDAGGEELDRASDGTSLAIVDGLTNALALQGKDPNSNSDVAAFYAQVQRRVQRFGPAVVTIDHMAKAAEAGERFALGAQHKLAVVDVAYTFESSVPLIARMRLQKDRHGYLRRMRDRLGEIRCPVLLLAGELDPAVPIEDAEELAASLPADRLRFVRFADAGHMLAAEQPEAVLALIREFVLEESE